jgi:hypothetical protein
MILLLEDWKDGGIVLVNLGAHIAIPQFKQSCYIDHYV